MMDSLDDLTRPNPATAVRPLLGLTVLVVEDSKFASDAMRLLCLRSGARIRRADSLFNAQKHLELYRPSIVIVDIGLPDGSGVDLIRDMTQAYPRVDVVLGTSADPDSEAKAMKAGADGFLAKPMGNIGEFQAQILKHLPAARQPNGLRLLSGDYVVPDTVALRDDFSAAAVALDGADNPRTLRYVTQFLGGLAHTAHDAPLALELRTLSDLQTKGQSVRSQIARVAAMVQDRIAQSASI